MGETSCRRFPPRPLQELYKKENRKYNFAFFTIVRQKAIAYAGLENGFAQHAHRFCEKVFCEKAFCVENFLQKLSTHSSRTLDKRKIDYCHGKCDTFYGIALPFCPIGGIYEKNMSVDYNCIGGICIAGMFFEGAGAE